MSDMKIEITRKILYDIYKDYMSFSLPIKLIDKKTAEDYGDGLSFVELNVNAKNSRDQTDYYIINILDSDSEDITISIAVREFYRYYMNHWWRYTRYETAPNDITYGLWKIASDFVCNNMAKILLKNITGIKYNLPVSYPTKFEFVNEMKNKSVEAVYEKLKEFIHNELQNNSDDLNGNNSKKQDKSFSNLSNNYLKKKQQDNNFKLKSDKSLNTEFNNNEYKSLTANDILDSIQNQNNKKMDDNINNNNNIINPKTINLPNVEDAISNTKINNDSTSADNVRQRLSDIKKNMNLSEDSFMFSDFEEENIDTNILFKMFKSRMEKLISGYQDLTYEVYDLEYSQQMSQIFNKNILLPSLIDYTIDELGIVLDLSGSISKEELDTFLNLIFSLLGTKKKNKKRVPHITIYTATTRIVQRYKRLTENTINLLDVNISGGTDLREPIIKILEENPKINNLLILTDTETPWPTPDQLNPKCKYFICISKKLYKEYKDFSLPWAKTLFF